MWLHAAAAAAVAFGGLLAVASILLLAAKLQYPFIGAGSTTAGVVKSIVLVALACLRVPLTVGGVEVSALPLGALAATGAILASTSRLVATRYVESRSFGAHVGAGAASVVPFALICWVASLVFEFEGGANPVEADPVAALLLGLVWGGLFGALGGAWAYAPVGALVLGVADKLRSRSSAYYGVLTGLACVLAALVAGAALALLWIIVALARDPAVPITIGTAAAAAIYLVAFAPNVAVAVMSIAIGATVDIGAKVTVRARALGSIAHFSLFDWNGRATPRGIVLLTLGPLALAAAAGFFLLRRRNAGATRSSIVIAAAVVACSLALLAWIGEARLGAGLVRPAGFARVAPRPLEVLGLGFAWFVAGGFLGWELARRLQDRGGRDHGSDT